MMRHRKAHETGLAGARLALPKSNFRVRLGQGQPVERGAIRQFAGVNKMKNHPSAFRMALAAITATTVGLISYCSVANAQNTYTSKPSAGSAVQAPTLQYGVGEVVKMYQGGIDKDIIVHYIQSTSRPYRLNADEIIYLQTLGVPQDITKAMLVRDGELQQQQPPANQPYYQPQQPIQGGMQPPGYGDMSGQPPVQQVATPTTPAPDATIYADSGYGTYGYGYPYYPYYYAGWPYYGYGYGWPWFAGARWGWCGRGWGWCGYRGGYCGGYRGGYVGIHGSVGFSSGGGYHGGGSYASGGGYHGGGSYGGAHGAVAFHGGGGGGGGHGGGGGGHR
jgi:hypothetical protein